MSQPSPPGKQPKIDTVTIASIHNMDGRRVMCIGAWFDFDGNFYQYDFYEPATDKINECTYDEVKKMVDSGVLTLHQPTLGRSLRPKKWK